MGIFDKLFGGDKTPEPQPAVPTDAPATPPDAGEAVPARRERVKRPVESTLPPGEFDPIPQAAAPLAPPAAPFGDDVENAALLNAVNAIVAGDGPETRQSLYRAILDAQLYLVSMPNPDGSGDELGTGEITLQEGQQIQLATVRSPDGQTYLPAFTDLERLKVSLPEKGRYLKMPAAAVCRMFAQGPGEGVVINPGQPPSGVITRAEAEVLAMNALPQLDEQGRVSAQAQQQVRIQIGKPERAPAASMLEAIRGSAQQQSIVREVHVFSAGVEEQPMRLMVGVLVDEGMTPEQMHPAFEAIGRAAYDARGDTEAFDMMPLQDAMIDAIRPLEGLVYVRSAIV